jgi:hypothetical protein
MASTTHKTPIFYMQGQLLNTRAREWEDSGIGFIEVTDGRAEIPFHWMRIYRADGPDPHYAHMQQLHWALMDKLYMRVPESGSMEEEFWNCPSCMARYEAFSPAYTGWDDEKYPNQLHFNTRFAKFYHQDQVPSVPIRLFVLPSRDEQNKIAEQVAPNGRGGGFSLSSLNKAINVPK